MALNQKNILALDVGTKSCGVAATDALGITVQPLETVFYKDQSEIKKVFAKLQEIISERLPQTIVVGLPLNADGTEGTQVKKVRAFIEGLKKHLASNNFAGPIQWKFFDERYTSEEAQNFFREHRVDKKRQKELIDTLAAVFILKRYLEE